MLLLLCPLQKSSTLWRKIISKAPSSFLWSILALALNLAVSNRAAEVAYGPALGVTVIGDVAYVSAGARGVIVLDIQDPKRPKLLGRCATGGEVSALVVAGNYAYVANGGAGLAVLDISVPSNPRMIGSLDTPGNVISVAVNGRYAYLADIWSGLTVVDVLQPDRPVSVSLLKDEKLNSVAAAGQFVYASANVGGFYTLDVTTPGNLQIANVYGIFRDDIVKSVTVAGNRLYAALDFAGLGVFEIPANGVPVWKGQVEVSGFASSVAVAENYAYVSGGLAGFTVVDVRDPSNPRPVSTYSTPGSVFAIAISGSHAFVADGWAGLQIFDITDPLRPAWESVYHTAMEPRALTIVTNTLYAGGGARGLRVMALPNNSEPQLLGEYTSTAEVKMAAIAGRYAFLAEGLAGVEIVDVTNPANLTHITTLPTAGEANAVAVSGHFLFLANGPAGLAVYDFAALTNSPIGSIPNLAKLPTTASVNGVTLDGNYALLAAGKEGLVIVDILNPAAPRVIGRYDTSGDARAVAVVANRAYVADGWAGVAAIDLTDRTKPRRLGVLETGGFAMNVGARDHIGLFADTFAVRSLDFTVPSLPWLRAEHKNLSALNVAVKGSQLYALTQSNTVAMLDVDPPLSLSPLGGATNLTGLQIHGAPGASILVQSSTNLSAWSDLRTVVLEPTGATIPISPSAEDARFYRALPNGGFLYSSIPEIPQVILDSDMGFDGDDIGDLVLLHKFADMGLCNILGVTFSVDMPYGPPALQAINTFYGRPNIPVAATKSNRVYGFDPFDRFLAENFPNTMGHGRNAPDAVRFYREILAQAAPRSITIIECSVIVTLRDVMLSGPDDLSPLTGEELLNQKVKLLAIVAGDYPSGTEFYFRFLPSYSSELVNRLRCPIVYSGETLGYYVLTAHATQLRQLVPPNSIMRVAYEKYFQHTGAQAREAWSQPMMLSIFASSTPGPQKLMDLERGGYNYVNEIGGNAWRTDQVDKSQAYFAPVARQADIVAALTSLMYLPPGEIPLPYDPHVNLFAQLVKSNGGTVSQSSLEALDEYVKTLKSDGTWDRKTIIWPCVGDNLNAALCLLKHPLTTSGIVRPVGNIPANFVESEGLVGNGQFALDTGLAVFYLGMRAHSSHLAVYSRTDVGGEGVVDCGRYDGGVASELILRYGQSYQNPIFDSGSVDSARITASQTYPTTGYYIGNRSSLTNAVLYRNQALIGSSQTGGGVLPSNNLMIFSSSEHIQNSHRTLSHFSAGPHLSPSQIITDSIATEKLQRALRRNVAP